MCFYIYAMTSDVYCNPVFVIERRQTFTVIKLHHWIAHAETMYPIKKTKMQFISYSRGSALESR